ncbi:MAG: phosphate regulon sensor histidine kinase PhoR [Candidatus Aphodousia sp.]|nr:phosphate regulon sensor histidine kinase PhoR [Sutterella sp.]MDY2900019.1 phosphate regulon sensor histidine kinase PhoR [Candidatus Aphodousia sp.]
MPAKDLTAKQRCLLGLILVAILATVMFLTSPLMVAMGVTLAALGLLVLYIVFNLSVHWVDVAEAIDYRQTQNRYTARIDRYRLSLSALPEGVVLFRQGHTLEWCNPAAERHLGIKLTEHLGKSLREVFSDQTLVSYLETGNFEKPIEVTSKLTGGILSLSAVVADETHFIVTTIDVTEQRRIERMRKDFVANVSHELRTPLTVIRGFLDMILADDKIDPKIVREQLELMQSEAARMHNLVNDLLALSRLENKDDTKNDLPEVVNMSKLVAALAEDAVMLSNGKHTINTDITTHKAVMGFVDEIKSACLNLVSNAVRYTPEDGKIDISWRVQEDGFAVFSVADTGIGIAPQDIPRLTERFYRVDKSRSRDTGGTGLGLAIVKHVAIRHHCQLKIDSELGKGSTFSLIFSPENVID